MKVSGHRRRPGVEDGHARSTLEKIGPFIGIRMPVHLAQAAGLNYNPCGGNGIRYEEVTTAHSACWCQWSLRTPPGPRRMLTPAMVVEI